MRKLLLALFILFLSPTAQALTIATWNVKHLGWGEQRDWDATARVAAIFDFVALQEVHGEDAVKRLESKLEVLTGEPWSSLVSDEAVGRGRYTENYAFIWREDLVDYEGGATLYLDPGDMFAREPFAARFCSDDKEYCWTAGTIHVVYGDRVGERREEARQLDEYVSWLEETIAEGTPVLLMGDFNLPPESAGFQDLALLLEPAISEGATTLSSTEGRYVNLYDNIWYRADSLPIAQAWIDRFPERLGITHEYATDHVSDHAPVVVQLGAETDINGPIEPYECGAKSTCGEMSNCAEAKFYLEQCGLTGLDRDGDGIPCESICQ